MFLNLKLEMLQLTLLQVDALGKTRCTITKYLNTLITITNLNYGLKNHTDINHKHDDENNLQCIANHPWMVSSNWVGYIVCNTL